MCLSVDIVEQFKYINLNNPVKNISLLASGCTDHFMTITVYNLFKRRKDLKTNKYSTNTKTFYFQLGVEPIGKSGKINHTF